MQKSISFKEIIERCHKKKSADYQVYYWHRLISVPITYLFFKLRVSPNAVSIGMVILSIISFFYLIEADKISLFYGFALSFLAFLFDKVDGDLARLYGVASIKGTIIDFVYHRFSLFLFYLGIGVHVYSDNIWVVVVAASCGFIANYIEEFQLLPYRVYAHKLIDQDELFLDAKSGNATEPFYWKLPKVFRMQLFLYYYFGAFFILEMLFNTSFVYEAMIVALISMSLYSVYQVYFIHQHAFSKIILELNSKINK